MNDNQPKTAPATVPAAMARVIGFVGEGQRVTITDPNWRPRPQPALQLVKPAPEE